MAHVPSLEAAKERTTIVSNEYKKLLIDGPNNIDLEIFQITPELEEKFRERLSKPLCGENWVSQCQADFYQQLLKGQNETKKWLKDLIDQGLAVEISEEEAVQWINDNRNHIVEFVPNPAIKAID